MKKQIFLLTGWGIGTKPLEPLATALTAKGYAVQLVDLPTGSLADEWLAQLAKQLPAESYWVGWSLGGQLLSVLLAEHGKQCLGLVTLGSNVCFKENASWTTAMPEDVFDGFYHNYSTQPERTQHRFVQLVVQGCAEGRSLAKQLQQWLPNVPLEQGLAGLDLLASLDTREALLSYSGRQLHVLAEQDALVPRRCGGALHALLPNASVEIVENTGHAFVYELAEPLAERLDLFFQATE